jgi:predicted  nucleic acid-binding Zn-ribbon protein
VTSLLQAQITSLRSQLEALSAELEAVKQKSKDAEKEQEDLLVFLEEMSTKRRRDKTRLRELGQDVSEDEGEEEEGGDDEE